MKLARLTGLCALACALSGCATVFEGTHQVITVNTNPVGANCTLNRNPEGVIGRINSTPASISIRKTKYDVTIKCYKPGYQEATYLNHSGAALATFGDAVLGGATAWAVDSAIGADNKYDGTVNVSLVPATRAFVPRPRAQLEPAKPGEPGS